MQHDLALRALSGNLVDDGVGEEAVDGQVA
jgi:hypothetical protein